MAIVREFGIGMLGIETGEYADQPCGFISKNKVAGPVGELQTGQNGPTTLDSVPDDWIVLIMPSRERAIEIADALVGSVLVRKANPTPAPGA